MADIKVIKNDIGESYTRAVLSNGLQIYVLEKPDYNSSYALFGTKYGSVDTVFSRDGGKNFTAVPEGIAHFLEHKLFESEDGDAFSRYAETGAMANAFTSFDRTCYLFSCGERFYDNLDILLDFVTHPYFTEKTVQKEQGIIGQEIRMYDDSPSWCVLFNLLRALYVKHPVRIDIAGTVESISEITAELLYECYNTFYNPANMFLCVAGNVSAEHIISVAEDKLKECKAVELVRGVIDEPDTVVTDYVEASLAVSVPLFCFGFKQKVDNKNRSLKERITMAMALDLLAGECSPLYKNLTDSGLINDEFETEYFTGEGYAAVLFSGESERAEDVKNAILEELNRIIENGVDSELLYTVRRAMLGDAIRRFNSVESLAMQLTECAVNGEDFFKEREIIGSVTAEEVVACLKTLRKEKSALSVILPKE